MQQGRWVVVGYDGSGRARSALGWAAREAALRGLSLRLVQAVPYAAAPTRGGAPDPETAVREESRVLGEGIRLASRWLDADRVSGVCIAGHPAGVLMAAAEHAALVVVGQRSQDAPVSSAIGSTSLVLAGQARCPVVVARGATGPERAELPVVVGVTGGASPRAALDFAAYTAQERSVPLTIVAAWSLPPAGEWRRAMHGFDTVAQWARELSARAAAAADESENHVRQLCPTLAVLTRVERLEAATALERASRRASLLVLGTQGSGRVARVVLGRSGCPVVVVPEGASSTNGPGAPSRGIPHLGVVVAAPAATCC